MTISSGEEKEQLYGYIRDSFSDILSQSRIEYLYTLIDLAYAMGGRDEIRKRISEMEAK